MRLDELERRLHHRHDRVVVTERELEQRDRGRRPESGDPNPAAVGQNDRLDGSRSRLVDRPACAATMARTDLVTAARLSLPACERGRSRGRQVRSRRRGCRDALQVSHDSEELRQVALLASLDQMRVKVIEQSARSLGLLRVEEYEAEDETWSPRDWARPISILEREGARELLLVEGSRGRRNRQPQTGQG